MFSENVKKYRKAKNLSQEELALKLYVVRQTVSKWEKGLSVPDIEILMKLAEILNISVNMLLNNERATRKVDVQMKYDVVIVGAGPGGIFAAYELMQNNPNLSVAVFEAGHSLDKRKCPIDGEKIKTNEKVKKIIANSRGKELNITVNRDYEIINVKITPEFVKNKYTAGIWIKDSCAGIGTITYINPKDMSLSEFIKWREEQGE